MSEYYDRQGNPIDMWEWVRLIEAKHHARRGGDDGWTTPEADFTRVGYDEIGDVRVSTVWLGLNHQWGNGPPLIFETMIFGGRHDEEQWRYSTEEQALAGHRNAVALVKGETPPAPDEPF